MVISVLVGILVSLAEMEYGQDKRMSLGMLQKTASIARFSNELVDVIFNCCYHDMGYPPEIQRDFDGEVVEIEAALWRLIRRTGYDLQEGLALRARLETPPSPPNSSLQTEADRSMMSIEDK